ncbi:ester cyclase [Paenibacillus oralis]|uniref:ester cyclase n=1 Tax=Paenibacillus oralis TaxID=2490856 RepID=UPI001FE7E6D3|nr:ester cyclase [Paenibacillus oralis]
MMFRCIVNTRVVDGKIAEHRGWIDMITMWHQRCGTIFEAKRNDLNCHVISQKKSGND